MLEVADFAEGTVLDSLTACLPCALYDALLDRRARILAPNASGVRVPQPAVVGARIRQAFADAGKVQKPPKVETRPSDTVQTGAPPLPVAAAVVKAALPKRGQTLSMFGAAVMAAPVGPKPPAAYTTAPVVDRPAPVAPAERVKAAANLEHLGLPGARPVEDYGDFGYPAANDTRGTVDEKTKRRANLARLMKKGE